MKNLFAERVIGAFRKAGPYMLVELLLPGGTLIALLLWLSSGTAKGYFAEPQPTAYSLSHIERVVAVPKLAAA